jgi:MFS family permease
VSLAAASQVVGPRYDGAARLTQEHKRNLVLASLGSMLEFYEFMVFGFFTIVIARLFFPPEMPEAAKTFQAFALFSLGFLLRPFAGAICGHFGDRFGRKRMFIVTVLLMAVPTTLIGLMPTYAQIGLAAPVILLLLRIVQGVAIAGEFAGASVFVTEHAAQGRLVTASGWLLGSSYLGFLLGAGIGALTANGLDATALESWGWRLPFILGGLFGVIGGCLRRKLDETPLFKAVRARRDVSKAYPVVETVKGHRVALAYVAGLGSYLGTMIIVLYFYMPTLLQTQYGVSRTVAFNTNAAALLVLALACPVWGRIADRIGCAAVLGFGACGLGIGLFVFFQNLDLIAGSPALLMDCYIGFSLLMATAATIPALSAMAFPTDVRLSGFGLGYNIGIVISAAAPTVMAWLVLAYGKTAVGWYALGLGVLGVALAASTLHIRFHLTDRE